MQRSATRLLVIVVAVLGCVITAGVSFTYLAEQRLAANLAQVRRPAAIDAYQTLVAELSGDWSFFFDEGSDITTRALRPGQQDVSQLAVFPEDAMEIIVGYQRLFEHLETVLAASMPQGVVVGGQGFGGFSGLTLRQPTDDRASQLRRMMEAARTRQPGLVASRPQRVVVGEQGFVEPGEGLRQPTDDRASRLRSMMLNARARQPGLVASRPQRVVVGEQGFVGPGEGLRQPTDDRASRLRSMMLNARARQPGLDLYSALSRRPGYKWPDDELSSIAEVLAANRDLLGEIREMADRGGPVCVLDFSEGLDLEPHHISPLHRCAALLRLDAVVMASQGNKSEAFDDIIAGMKLGDALANEPLLASQRLRTDTYATMTSTFQSLFDAGDLTREQTQRLMAHAAQAYNRHALGESLAGELYMALQSFSDLRTRDPEMLDLFSELIDSSDTVERLFLTTYKSTLGRPWLNMDGAAYIDIMSRASSAAELPYYEAAPQLMRLETETRNLPNTRILAKMHIVSGLSGTCEAQARHEATLDLMQMGILVEQYKASTGTYPEDLDAIVPELGGSLPVDPFTGKAYQYQPSDDGFLLYSVGSNLTDDGGRHSFGSGDIVWRGE